MIIVLDTYPASSVSKKSGRQPLTTSDLCHQWITKCENEGHLVLVPAISYYEVLRELEQRQASAQIARLKAFCLEAFRFLPLTTEDLELAARLWGQTRRSGLPTADPKALDADLILVAQVLNLGFDTKDLIVATTNPSHISRFVPANLWENIPL